MMVKYLTSRRSVLETVRMKKLQKVQTVDLSNSTNPNRDLLTHY